jgi:hypothetical protein
MLARMWSFLEAEEGSSPHREFLRKVTSSDIGASLRTQSFNLFESCEILEIEGKKTLHSIRKHAHEHLPRLLQAARS